MFFRQVRTVSMALVWAGAAPLFPLAFRSGRRKIDRAMVRAKTPAETMQTQRKPITIKKVPTAGPTMLPQLLSISRMEKRAVRFWSFASRS